MICLAVCIGACHNKNAVPAGILEKNQMQGVLWDIMQADAFTNFFIKKDASKNPVIENAKLQEQIFAMHHISREDFYKSYNYYKEHPGMMVAILDSITSNQTRIENVKRQKAVANRNQVMDSLKIKTINNKNIQKKPTINSPVTANKTKAKKKKKKSVKLKVSAPASH
jgi:hypothetical protein